MTIINKTDAMALIHRTNQTLESMPNRVKGKRHLADYLEKITEALQPLADHEPVSEPISRLLHGWTDLFIHEENDEANLQGLPELLLQLGANLFYTDVSGHSTITKLPRLSTSVDNTQGEPLDVVNSSSYFFNAFMVPYLAKELHANVFMQVSGATSPYSLYNRFFTAKSINKSGLLVNIERHLETHWLIGEKLALQSGQETLISHILKIGNSKRSIHADTSSYKNYVKRLNEYSITESKLNAFATLADYHITTAQITKHQATPMTDEESRLLTHHENSLIKDARWPALRCLINLGAPISPVRTWLANLCSTTSRTPYSLDFKEHIDTIKTLSTITSDPKIATAIKQSTIPYFSKYFTDDINGYYSYLHHYAYPDELFQAVFQCSLNDISSLHRLPRADLIRLLTTALNSSASHPTRKALRAYYREQLEKNFELPPIFAAIYCFSQSYANTRFFSLTQATFERLLLSESSSPFNFIHDLFVIMQECYSNAPHTVSYFKDKLIHAIVALSPESKLKLMALIKQNGNCLALQLLKTRQHTDATKNTFHYRSLLEKLSELTAADYRDYDSSDDEVEIHVPTITLNDADAAIFQEYRHQPQGVHQAAFLFKLLLDSRLAEARTLIQAAEIDLSRSFNWIQSHIHGVSINGKEGSIALKLWTETTLDEPTKIKLTTFLTENGFCVFDLVRTSDQLNKMGLSSNTLNNHLIMLCKAGILEAHFYKSSKARLYTTHNHPLAEMMLNYRSEQPRPVTALLHHHAMNHQFNDINLLLLHFMTSITHEQALGLTHCLRIFDQTQLAETQKQMCDLINSSPEAIERFKALKANKTPCALFLILKEAKYKPMHLPTAYTVFKQKHLPKAVPAALLEKEATEKMRIASK